MLSLSKRRLPPNRLGKGRAVTRRMTAGQFAQFGQHLVDGLGWAPTSEEAQAILGNADAVKQLKAQGAQLAPMLRAISSVNTRSLLELITKVSLPGIETFVAKDHFREKGAPGGITFWLGSNFKRHFLDKVETNVSPSELAVHKLKRSSVDRPIIAEVGGEEAAETSLAQLWQLISGQQNGEEGSLLTDGYANIFYIRDSRATVWAVNCNWNRVNRNWNVEANPISNPIKWNPDNQVFSRDSSSSPPLGGVLLIRPFRQPPIILPKDSTSVPRDEY